MANVLECQDRWGRIIVLADHTWNGHILDDHAEMAGDLYAIEQAITRPDRVHFDKDYPDREVFYRRGVMPHPDHRDYLKVVVVIYQSGAASHGRIVTAYPTPRLKTGERKKWP